MVDKKLMPRLPKPLLRSTRKRPTSSALKRFDVVLILHGHKSPDKLTLPGASALGDMAKRTDNAGQVRAALPEHPSTVLVAVELKSNMTSFEIDEQLGAAAATLKSLHAAQIALVIDIESLGDTAGAARRAVFALTVSRFDLPFFGKRKRREPNIDITVFEPRKTDLQSTLANARGNCMARWLTALPPNKLDATGYADLCAALAKRYGWQYKFISASMLKRRGAGAFTAVAQGNENNDAGIVCLKYRPKPQSRHRKHVGLVGKGIIFDTGGTNLKPFDGMLNMHIDMGGSAVAVGSLLALAEQNIDINLDVWLAITENRTSASAYKSQDVVTALNGMTIQTIHTDAEGRMVLADTLTLASREKPDCILDFATLTGACVNAVTTRYAGVFTNRGALHSLLTQNGIDSGERVWPFPIGGEFRRMLKSDTADIQQCSPGGGGDHILAATFLSEFVDDKIPWVHMDLSAVEHKGGLGAVTTSITGFGVRYTVDLINEHLAELVRAKKS
ncbi:MAG: leucyl aminopeptidase family protein [Pseudomonadota bacterium]